MILQNRGKRITGIRIFPLHDISLGPLGICGPFDFWHIDDAVAQLAVDFLALFKCSPDFRCKDRPTFGIPLYLSKQRFQIILRPKDP